MHYKVIRQQGFCDVVARLAQTKGIQTMNAGEVCMSTVMSILILSLPNS